MSKKIKLLFYGDSPSCATGFGTVSRNILVPLHQSGRFDITVLGINYWGIPHDFPFPIWPVGIGPGSDPYGRERIQQQIANSEFDILFMIQDSFILEFAKDFIPKLKNMGKKFASVVYFPIDGVPKKEWVEAMSAFDFPVTYTRWGKSECVSLVPEIEDRLQVMPHGVNVSDYYPVPTHEMVKFRSTYFGPFYDHFIWCNVNRNQQRKDIPKAMLAFKKFKEMVPKTVLYLHMSPIDQGWDLPKVAESMGLVVGRDIVFPHNFGPNQGFPRHILNLIYNASDCVLSTTLGEGWGLSTVEAMATKTPILFPSNTSLHEIIGDDRGVFIESGADLEHYMVLPNDNEVVRPTVSVADMIQKMLFIYENEYIRDKVAHNAYEWVTNTLIWDKHIVPGWVEILDRAYTHVSEQVSADTADGVVAEEL